MLAVRLLVRDALVKPLLHYPGSKWGAAPWIIRHFPAHTAYVEPFFGSGAVLMRKPPVRSELANDINGAVVAFFRMVRDAPQELAAAIAMTPYARDELAAARTDLHGDLTDLEKARRLAILGWQTRGGAQRRHPAWRFDMHGDARKSLSGTWADLPGRILAVADRFRTVAIENRPALEVIEKCSARQGEKILIYADPPYLFGSTDERLYDHDMRTVDDHLELLGRLDAHPGPVVLSAYDHPAYTERLASWVRVTRKSRNQSNAARLEILWLNPVAARQASLDLLMDDLDQEYSERTLVDEAKSPASLAGAAGSDLRDTPAERTIIRDDSVRGLSMVLDDTGPA